MARIARVVAPDIPYHITQGGTGGTAGEMSMVSPELVNDGPGWSWLYLQARCASQGYSLPPRSHTHINLASCQVFQSLTSSKADGGQA